MGGLSTHVLDTALGKPGQDIKLSLFHLGEQRELVCETRTNEDGRTDAPLLDGTKFAESAEGTYELVFDVAEYFARCHEGAPQPPFLDVITLRFTIADNSHYHVPLLLSPWSYSTYRGS